MRTTYKPSWLPLCGTVEPLGDFQSVGVLSREDRLSLAGVRLHCKAAPGLAGNPSHRPDRHRAAAVEKNCLLVLSKVQQKDRPLDTTRVIAEDVFRTGAVKALILGDDDRLLLSRGRRCDRSRRRGGGRARSLFLSGNRNFPAVGLDVVPLPGRKPNNGKNNCYPGFTVHCFTCGDRAFPAPGRIRNRPTDGNAPAASDPWPFRAPRHAAAPPPDNTASNWARTGIRMLLRSMPAEKETPSIGKRG